MTTEDAAAAGRPPTSPLTVLVVEDEQLVRDLVDEFLTAAGYHVLTAADADSAEEAAANEAKLDALVIDAFVPGGGGAPLAERLRARHPRAAVLIVSGSTEQEGTTGHAVIRFLAKPFTGAQLRAALSDALADRPELPD